MRSSMSRRSIVVLVLSLALPGLAGAAPDPKPAPEVKDAKDKAAAGPGTAAVKQAYATIQGLLKQKVAAGSKEEKELAAKITTSIRGFLDIEQLGKRAMVDNWSKLSRPQQDQFL